MAIDEALSAAFGHETPAYNRYRDAATLDNGPHTMRIEPAWGRGGALNDAARDAQDAVEARQYLAEGKQQSIALLRQAINTLEDEIADQEPSAPPNSLRDVGHSRNLSKVFVVHGHDPSAREEVGRFLDRIGLEAVILQEKPDRGQTVIEKFESNANEVRFAVVLLTPDDVGGAVVEPAQSARARQNVIFELGYFVGKLGRGRACLLRKGNVEIPSDLAGVIYTELDPAGGWKLRLATELKEAGLVFDASKLIG